MIALLSSVARAQEPQWVEHRVRAGDRVAEIAALYQAEPAAIVSENGLEESGLRAGATLRVPARRLVKRIEYIVRFGDKWETIAERHGVTESELRRWNRELPRAFAAGDVLQIWVEQGFEPTLPSAGLGVATDTAGLPLVEVTQGATSAGQPDRGRLIDGVRLPRNPALYFVRRREFAYGSTLTLTQLQAAIARFRRNTGYRRPLVVSDISKKRGGAYGSHDSHQSGRDVDLWLPLRSERVAELDAAALDPQAPDYEQLGTERIADIDWHATWALIKALLRTGHVQYIFLSRARQRALYRAAREEGMSVQALGEVIQYPRRARTGVVRHAPKHTKHLHIRFRCADHERRCR